MANSIIPKKSATPSAIPTSGDLLVGEIASNTADGLLFIKKTDGTIITIGAGGGGGGGSLNWFIAKSNITLYITCNTVANGSITGDGQEIVAELLEMPYVVPGTYGDSDNIPVVEVDTYGRIATISTVPASGGGGGGGGGAAGGDGGQW